MPRIVLDYEPAWDGAPQIEGDSSDLVYFLSWAFSARYGANHEMSLASLVLRGDFGIDLKPLLTFADRNVEEPEDEEQLRRAWQEAAPLAETCARIAEALDSGEKRLETVQEDYPALRDTIAALGRLAAAADSRGATIRVTFELE